MSDSQWYGKKKKEYIQNKNYSNLQNGGITD